MPPICRKPVEVAVLQVASPGIEANAFSRRPNNKSLGLLLLVGLLSVAVGEWTKLPEPVLTAVHGYEQKCVCEPLVMSDPTAAHKYRMYFRSGWGSTAVGVAFSDDGMTWERYDGNPLTPPGDGLGGMQFKTGLGSQSVVQKMD